MEHVADPDGFMRAVARCLKPGGSFMFATPNGGHYFTIAAKAVHRLKIDELVLRLVRGGKEEEYHYPVQYLFNTERAIDACARRTGFSTPEYAYIEYQGPGGYMRGPLKPLYHLLRLKRRVVRRPKSLLCMIGRITKAA